MADNGVPVERLGSQNRQEPPRQDHDGPEDLEGQDGAHDQGRLDAGLEQGQDHQAHLLPPAAAEDLRGLQVVFGDHLQAGKENDHHQRRGPPHFRDHHRSHQPLGAAAGKVQYGPFDKPQILQEAVEITPLGEDGQPDQPRGQIGNPQGNRVDVQQGGGAPALFVDDQRGQEGQNQLGGDDQQGQKQRVLQRIREVDIGKQPLPVGEGEPASPGAEGRAHNLHQRHKEKEHQKEQSRGQQEIG